MKLNIEKALEGIKGEKVNGVVYIKNSDYKASQNGKSFVTGQFTDQGKSISFKVWSENVEKFKAIADKQIINISGTIDVWNGTTSIVVDNVEEDIFKYGPADFLLGHDKIAMEQKFDEFVEQNLSPKAKELLAHILQGEVRERFLTEFAAKGMHDACPSGLLAHVLKMLNLLKALLENDEELAKFADLLYLGVIFHDVGKIYELYMGQYVQNSFISHRELGCELMYKNQEYIINLYDEDFFYRLLSILRGHHHVYEEKAKTIYAYIVHLIDMLDSQSTRITDCIRAGSVTVDSRGNVTVGCRDEILAI